MSSLKRCDKCGVLSNKAISVGMFTSCKNNECAEYLAEIAGVDMNPPVIDPCEDCNIRPKTDTFEDNDRWYLVCRECLLRRANELNLKMNAKN